jgi:hypothetical protein
MNAIAIIWRVSVFSRVRYKWSNPKATNIPFASRKPAAVEGSAPNRATASDHPAVLIQRRHMHQVRALLSVEGCIVDRRVANSAGIFCIRKKSLTRLNEVRLVCERLGGTSVALKHSAKRSLTCYAGGL